MAGAGGDSSAAALATLSVRRERWGGAAHAHHAHYPHLSYLGALPAGDAPQDPTLPSAALEPEQAAVSLPHTNVDPILRAVLHAMLSSAEEKLWERPVAVVGVMLLHYASRPASPFELLFAVSGYEDTESQLVSIKITQFIDSFTDTEVVPELRDPNATRVIVTRLVGEYFIPKSMEPQDVNAAAIRLAQALATHDHTASADERLFSRSLSPRELLKLTLRVAHTDPLDAKVRAYLAQHVSDSEHASMPHLATALAGKNMSITRCTIDTQMRGDYVKAIARLSCVEGGLSRYSLDASSDVRDRMNPPQCVFVYQNGKQKRGANARGDTGLFIRMWPDNWAPTGNDVGKCAGAKLAMKLRRIRLSGVGADVVCFGEAAWTDPSNNRTAIGVDFVDAWGASGQPKFSSQRIPQCWSELTPSCPSCQQQIVDILTPSFWARAADAVVPPLSVAELAEMTASARSSMPSARRAGPGAAREGRDVAAGASAGAAAVAARTSIPRTTSPRSRAGSHHSSSSDRSRSGSASDDAPTRQFGAMHMAQSSGVSGAYAARKSPHSLSVAPSSAAGRPAPPRPAGGAQDAAPRSAHRAAAAAATPRSSAHTASSRTPAGTDVAAGAAGGGVTPAAAATSRRHDSLTLRSGSSHVRRPL